MAMYGLKAYNIHRNYDYWIASLPVIAIVSFIIGSRTYGADYNWYKYQFEHASLTSMLQEQQPFFVYINRFLTEIGFNYVGAFTTYTFVYLCGAFYLLRSYGTDSKYMFLFLLPSYIGFGTDIIRQTFATGFILFAIPLLDKKKYIGVGLLVAIAYAIHSSTIVIFAIYLAFKYFSKKPLNPIYTIPLYILIVLFYDSNLTGNIAPYISKLNLGDSKFQGYVDASDRWFSNDAANDIYSQGAAALFVNTLYVVGLFYIGYIALRCKLNTRIIPIYNIVVVGYILLRMVFQFEILRRFAIPMTMFFPIVIGYSLSVSSKIKNIRYIKISILSVFLFLITYWGRFIFMYPDGKFFWDN